MSLVETCWWTTVRTIALCLLAWPACRMIERYLRQLADPGYSRSLVLLIFPACFPELLVGYGYRDFALARPALAEFLCSVLLLARMIPVGTIALLAAPRPGTDAAAIHCRKLLLNAHRDSIREWMELARCYWYGPIRRVLPSLALMSLIAFQEFETAALLQTISWYDWFIASERLGLDKDQLVLKSLLPVAWQLPLQVGLVQWLQSSLRSTDGADGGEAEQSAGQYLWIGMALIGVLVTVECLVPMASISWRAIDGLVGLSRHHLQLWGLAREILTSLVVALCAGMTAWGLSRPMNLFTIIGSTFGLFGSLLLSLGAVALFQMPWLRPLYDTPLPWVLALIVWLLPRAAILRLWLRLLNDREGFHVAQLVGPSEGRRNLTWRLDGQGKFLAASLLCYWAYCDLPSAYLLAPTGMASGLVRLYNFMHFGRSAALSAEACVFFGAPVIIVSVLYVAVRWCTR